LLIRSTFRTIGILRGGLEGKVPAFGKKLVLSARGEIEIGLTV